MLISDLQGLIKRKARGSGTTEVRSSKCKGSFKVNEKGNIQFYCSFSNDFIDELSWLAGDNINLCPYNGTFYIYKTLDRSGNKLLRGEKDKNGRSRHSVSVGNIDMSSNEYIKKMLITGPIYFRGDKIYDEKNQVLVKIIFD